jgi:hypothetical protein
MNLYYASDTFVEPSGFKWVPQQVIAPTEQAARKILPHGENRQIVLVYMGIDESQPKINTDVV